jgi:hypothetical protein
VRLITIKLGVATRAEVFAKIYAQILEGIAIPEPGNGLKSDAPDDRKLASTGSLGADGKWKQRLKARGEVT